MSSCCKAIFVPVLVAVTGFALALGVKVAMSMPLTSWIGIVVTVWSVISLAVTYVVFEFSKVWLKDYVKPATGYGSVCALVWMAGSVGVFFLIITCLIPTPFTGCAPTATVSPSQSYWVLLVDSPEMAMKPSDATETVFEVAPMRNTIDGLKDAVKAKVEANTGDRVNALTMKVYARIAGGVWAEVFEPWTPLIANTGLTAYHVVVQKP